MINNREIMCVGGVLDGKIVTLSGYSRALDVPFSGGTARYVLVTYVKVNSDGTIARSHVLKHSRDIESFGIFQSEIEEQRGWIKDYYECPDDNNRLSADEFAGLLSDALDEIEKLHIRIRDMGEHIDKLTASSDCYAKEDAAD